MQSIKRAWNKTPKLIRQLFVGLVGLVVIVTGIILLPLPGPGWAIIFVGLAILSTEFPWAMRIRNWIISKFKSAFQAIKKKPKK